MRLALSQCIPRIALAAAIALALAACVGNDDEKRATETATTVPAAESGAPVLPPTTPATTASQTVLEELETAARELLANELDLDAEDLELQSSEAVEWSDASLGCPQEGYAYAQVITPGYKLVFDLAGTSHAVHTNADGSHMVICADGQ
ncbi:MAG: hypothetical protein OXR64_05295 [Chloroflexota bacterium]|nr:hypothetical protein [Chloroflexota bacterium]MDE2919244.1 hypothetical protein [Chloroflexota bacterium]